MEREREREREQNVMLETEKKNGRKLEIIKLEVSLSLVFYVLRGERHKKIVKIKIYPFFNRGK